MEGEKNSRWLAHSYHMGNSPVAYTEADHEWIEKMYQAGQ